MAPISAFFGHWQNFERLAVAVYAQQIISTWTQIRKLATLALDMWAFSSAPRLFFARS